MLFPTFCTKALLGLALTSFAVGNVISAEDQLPDASQFPTDVKQLVGEPELAKASKLRIREDIPEIADTFDKRLEVRALSNDENEALRLHNEARAKKGLPALAWDATLASHALAWAKSNAANNKMEHSSGDQRPNEGENLAFVGSSGTIPNPLTLGAKMWVGEEGNYHGEVIPQGDFGSYGHYTQVMWKSTTKVGIAAASDGKGGWYIVGRYSPPGNWVGQKPY